MLRKFRYIFFLYGISLGFSLNTFAQKIPSDSLYKAQLNTPTAKDTAFGQKAKKVVPKTLYNALFRDIYNSKDSSQVSEIEQNPHAPYEGRWIRKIYVHALDVFGYSVYDTLRKPTRWTERAGNHLHRTTRAKVIVRNFLFFEEGDLIDPEKLKDNERYLRQQGIFHDVRIVIVPYPNAKDAVDIHVYTQDLWSLLPDGSASALDNFSIGLEQRNFRGQGHSFKNTIAYNGLDPRQRLEYSSRYFIPSFGKTFISGQADLLILRDQKQAIFKVFRPFLTPQMKYAGAFEASLNNVRLFEFVRNPLTNLSERNYFWAKYSFVDAWIGRSFQLFFGNDQLRDRARLVIALRHTRQYFYNRDRAVTDSTNQLLQNTRPTLLSFGFSNRRYQRDLLIYGFGRTEDVPIGDLVAVIYGSDPAELGKRNYIGVKFSTARYLHKGYLYNLTNIGTYVKRNGGTQQGVLGSETNYFTPLLPLGKKWFARHFLRVQFAWGFNRFQNEFLNIGGSQGIGINSDELRGTRKLLIGAESVFFSPINFLGFRIAPFLFANVGWATFAPEPFFGRKPYQGYGIGFRIRNENLTFNSFQFRLTYFAGIPGIVQPLRAGFEGIPPLRFRDFDISAPEVITFK
ncbi:MAG: hypothetical protein ACK4GN_08125 [Runella sp.]